MSSYQVGLSSQCRLNVMPIGVDLGVQLVWLSKVTNRVRVLSHRVGLLELACSNARVTNNAQAHRSAAVMVVVTSV